MLSPAILVRTHALAHSLSHARTLSRTHSQGAAVFNGAFSTWLAVVTLGSSKSYVFITFFKQLFLCTSFGLFHGIVVLPVLLSLVNPRPFEKSAEQRALADAGTEQRALAGAGAGAPAAGIAM